jgi:hypothetical protein
MSDTITTPVTPPAIRDGHANAPAAVPGHYLRLGLAGVADAIAPK